MKEKSKLIKNQKLLHASEEWKKLLEERKDEEALHYYCTNIVEILIPHLREGFKKNTIRKR